MGLHARNIRDHVLIVNIRSRV